MGNIITVQNMMKAFGTKKALTDVSFNIKKGEIFGFLGPSGSGKTTTVKILTSQLKHSSGNISIFGQDLTKWKKENMKEIGILTDNSALYDRLTVYDNLKLYCDLYDVNNKRIDEVLQDVNLIEEKKTAVNKLSKGMKQRVLLARAILHKPALLFLDEPTSALDPVNRQKMHDVLRQLNEEGTTIFLTTHDMSEAEILCDRIAFLHNGEIAALDTPENLRLQYAENTIEITLTNREKEMVTKDEAGAQRIFEWLNRGEILTIHSKEPNLGDIFIQLTGRGL
ncbi:ABC transporter ATP-binding protein [Priestia taiwanensis]|uniref:Bacitracin ABC transporter ATP-binding protein n=1 Tax=Priestia taiwanensis TaxID=1347902 RepID=A0A917ES84_9BACI|nr:ABC transporter ATP-binding protein [Priestia taiwanensis]MBM7364409.1 ABC-type multidrug transport system ATPase subunit [Priestia taiwanensis]GGE81645.1 bacitracin ABC transporter ATP-binding protein [Priestia taiwanensis]